MTGRHLLAYRDVFTAPWKQMLVVLLSTVEMCASHYSYIESIKERIMRPHSGIAPGA